MRVQNQKKLEEVISQTKRPYILIQKSELTVHSNKLEVVMKYRFLIIAIACLALVFISCGKQEPVSPSIEELSGDNQDVSLSKKPSEKFVPWEGSQISGEEIDPGRVWISDDGIQHLRGRVIIDIIKADDDRVAGYITITQNRNLNLTTYDGTYSSKWSLKPDAYDGTWEGVFTGEIRSAIFSGHGHGKGTGELEGMKLTVEAQETAPPYLEIPESGYIVVKK